MIVSLIDVDNKYRNPIARGKRFQNLALMKISAWYKELGYTVGFDLKSPNLTVVSCVFKRNRLNAIFEVLNTNENTRWFGGSGFEIHEELPNLIEHTKPDYDLYSYQEYSMGFTTRGCIRNCEFCIVHTKEGKFKRHAHISEFADPRFKVIKLLDNNILADIEWFHENMDWAMQHKYRVDITQGMDIRLMTPEIAKYLKTLKFYKGQIRFAWDDLKYEDKVITGIQMLKDAGINTKQNVSFYVLAGFKDQTFEDAKYRCDKLKDLRCNSYLMRYEDNDPRLKHLAKWSNYRRLYWSTTSEEYLKSKGF